MSKKKVYPLEILDGYEGDCFFSRGHHDKAEFIRTLQDEYGVTATEDNVEHCYYRLTPSENWNDCRMSYTSASGPGRGVFPVTLVADFYDYHGKTEVELP